MKLKRFWQAIESIPGQAAVMAEWRAGSDADFDFVKTFLKPRPDRATSYPNLDGGLPFTVVEHAENDIVGVCRDSGRTIPLTKNQLIVYELDRRKLANHLVRPLGLDSDGDIEIWDGTTIYLGQFSSTTKLCYSVFLIFPSESNDVFNLVTRLIAEKRTPFIMLSPSRRWLRRIAETAMRFHGSVFVSLGDAITAPHPGHLEPAEPLSSIVARETGVVWAMKSRKEVEIGRNVFRLEGDFWTLTFADKTVRLKDSLGLNCIAHLISKERCDIDAAVLRAVATKNIMTKPSAGIEALDQEAIEQYKIEHNNLLEELEEAKEFNDIGKGEQIQGRIDALTQHVTSAKGFGGRIRKTNDQAANARTSLTNAISRTIKSLQKNHADLARHLDNSIRTGQSISYSPETDVDWDL